MPFLDADVERLMSGLYRLGATPGESGRSAGQRIAAALATAIECDAALLLRIDRACEHVSVERWPPDLALPTLTPELIARHRFEHPLALQMQRALALRAWRLSEVAGGAQFSASDLARDTYAALPARHQMALRLASPDGDWHAVALLRDRRDFSDGEQRALELMWLHLVRALRNAVRARRGGAPGASLERTREERGIAVLDADLQVRLCNERARLWLAEYFPDTVSRHRIRLPPALHEFASLRTQGERHGLANPPPQRDPFVQPKGEHYLVVDLIVDHGRGEHLMTFAQEALVAPAASLRGLGLTPRETEVLAWVAQGKTNDEIGRVLGASGRTVQKHLERIYPKLGVESRTAATLKAWQVARFAMLGR